MNRFIEVTLATGEKRIYNVAYITSVYVKPEGCYICWQQGVNTAEVLVQESYSQLTLLFGAKGAYGFTPLETQVVA